MESRSLVEICGSYMTKCGYCKPEKKTSVSYGVLAKRLTCADYQELIDRGWRRSGTFVYKPVMHETCCPQYTIRLDVTRFKPTKGQRHVLNRLRRYLDGDSSGTSGRSGVATPPKSGPTNRIAPTSGANGGSASTAKRGPSREGGASALRGGKGGSSNGDAGGGGSEGLGRLSERVAAAAVAAVEAGFISGLRVEGEWLAEVVGWSQVRPIRNKKCRVSGGGGFCSAVALSIASAARRRGWEGTGGAGGALAIAEAIVESMRGERTGSGEGPKISDISVAPNGFINFGAEFGSPPTSTAVQHRPPVPPTGPASVATAAQTPTPPASPPPVPVPAPTRPTRDNMPPHNSTSGGNAHANRTRAAGLSSRELPAEGNGGSGSSTVGKGGEGVCSRFESKEVDSSGASSDPPGAGASATDGDHVGRDGTAGQGNGELTAAGAAARMEWVERHANSAGVMDVETSSTPSDATTPIAAGSGSRTGLSSLPPLDPGLAPHRMTVWTVPARVTDEVFRLYLKYQVSVHGDLPSEVTRTQFRRFLVDSPLIRETVDGTVIRPRRKLSHRGRDGRPTFPAAEGAAEGVAGEEDAEVTEGRDSLSVPYGSYHQLYRIDGRLVAVGVVDVLPKCLSSVYCFYDPDFRALALGKLTALKETEFVREARAVRPALRDYYMGFYIHTCPKMSYKGSYSPSFLLCPERLTWVPLELCRPVLDKNKYARLSDLLEPPPLADASSDTGTHTGSGSGSDSGGLNGGAGSGEGQCDGRPSAQSPAGSSSSKQSQADGWDDWGVAPAADQKSSGCSSTSYQACLSAERRTPGQGRSSKAPGSCSARSGSGSGVMAGLNGASGGDGGGGGGGDGGDISRREMAAAVRRAAVARAADEASGIYEIPLMVGRPSYPVSLSALMPQSQAIARDVLRTYIATIGSDLAKRVILKLSN